METSDKLCDLAVKYAQSFEKKLDYSDNSIDELEKILNIYQIQMKAENADDKEIMSAALIFGAYVGETLLKNGFSDRGYKWEIDEEGIPFLNNNKREKVLKPVYKVFKRLKNGAEDSIKLFYDKIFFLDEKGE